MENNKKKTRKKSRVSWPSDSTLCQVKMFQTVDCPAKVGFQSCSKPKASYLPPGYEGTDYSMRLNISHIPRITWKRPLKFILSDDLLVASGEESTVTPSENLRIAKVLEAFYPHHSLIPISPSLSPAVQVESYDDSETPNIRLTPIEDEDKPEAVAVDSSHNSNAPPSVLGLGPDLSLAASAALSALIKTKEQGSLVDPELLVKFLSDPIIIKKLLNDSTAAQPLETGNNTTKPPPQHVTTSSAMDRNSPPKPTIPHHGNGVPHVVPVLAAQSIVSHVPTQSPVSSAPLILHTYPLSSALKPQPRVEDSLKPSSVDDVVVSEPQCHSLDVSTSGTSNMSRVLESARTGTDAPGRNGAYPMNITRHDYFKNLIREHGGVTPATNGTNNFKGRVDNNNNMKAVKVKFQKPCMFFGRGRGCKAGESCLYLHDSSKRLWTDVAAPEFPKAKRLKFRT